MAAVAEDRHPRPGDLAPDFTLPDTHGTPVHLGGHRGRPVLLVFYPFAFSGTCTHELAGLRDNLEAFDTAGATLLGISCDSVFAQKAWDEQQGFGFDLLSDFWPHGEVARSYGVLDERRGLAVRGSFLVDADGVVRWSVVNPPGRARDLDSYRRALAQL
ncbi:redoxin domain-containing protein [Cellulosimicrobium arenosum]|uniref:Alkyl hydroperoxide reductase E n=1 Tax=Cellulosimicrobium arenosum TaxID=2708133 RepID=A0A927G6J4_9MICO|nr:peroxiredoxin [Cellulosimicrobium arenosum]